MKTSNNSPSNSSVAEILARMQASGELQYELDPEITLPNVTPASANPQSAEPTAKAPTAAPPPERPVPSANTSDASPNETTESSVTDYMNRLLNRHQQSPTVSVEKVEDVKITRPSQPAQAAVEPVAPWNPEEYVPRSVAPERQTNLDALRELAIQSNRNAIQSFHRSRVQSTSKTWLMIGAALSLFGVLFSFLSNSIFDVPMMLAISSFLSGGFSIWKMRKAIKAERAESN